ncbi:MAG: peptidoglycan DD-metalloendopeptidase family protein [Bacillota bacterium]
MRELLFAFWSKLKEMLSKFRGKLDFQEEPLDHVQVIGIAGFIIFLMMISAILANENRPWAVRLGGRVVAVVADKNAAQAAFAELLSERARAFGQPVSIAERITFERAGKTDGPAVDINLFKEILAREVEVSTRATAILINGKKALVVPDQETAERLLASLKEQYASGFPGQAAFAEDVRLQTVNADVNEILTFEKAFSLIAKGTREKQTYTVKDGDTLWGIANAFRLDLEKLLAMNPGLSPDRLQVGQTINLSAYSPLINVIVTGKITVKEEIPFPVEEREDNSLYKGQHRLVQQGSPGEKEVTYAVTYKNGLEESRQALSEEVLRKPTAQIVAKGSRLLLAARSGGSGRLGWPAAGPVVSPFGWRGREFHAGIDIGADTGAPVWAAESGRVIRAGWYGGYGKCVDINHGGGVVTRYAHLSAISVGIGEQVSRGQLIGRVGSTGYATGPHLHFEVIADGRPLNPVQFL